MFQTISKFFSYKNYLPAFVFLIACYFAIGGFLITYTPMTTDEVAHLSAAQGITAGLDLNLEHPPLLKALNSIPLGIFFNDFHSNEMGQWIRSATFLTETKYNQHDILTTSRWVYLVFNSLLLIWLLFYTTLFKLIEPKIGLILGVLYVFSPSFYSHNYFITFDVAGSITNLMAIMTFGLLYYNYEKLSKPQIVTQFVIGSIALFAALNTKFSNYLTLLLLILFSIGLSLHWRKLKKYDLSRKILQITLAILVSIFTFTWILFSVCYRNTNILIPDISDSGPQLSIAKNWLTAPVFRLTRGLLGSLGRSGDPFYNFIGNHNQAITYSQFLSRVFWYKENPGLIIIFIVFGVLLITFLMRSYINKKRFNLVEIFKNYTREATFIIFVFIFPVLYVLSAWNTKFTIGYRHFYPALIFIYLAVAIMLYEYFLKKQNFVRQYTFIILIVFYTLYGLIGIPQTYNYVNFFWTEPAWKLTTDSTLSWADGGGWGLRYLKQNSLLQRNNKNTYSKFNTVMDVYIAPTFPVYVEEALGQDNLKDNIDSLKTDITKTRIRDIKTTYLIADIYSFQKTSNEIYIKHDLDGISRENLDFLLNHKPIYEKNGVAFVYNLDEIFGR